MHLPSLDRVAFLLSLAVLAWFYGFATSARQWFPNDLLVRAWHQAQAIGAPPAWTAPRVYDREGVRILEPDQVQPGFNLIASYWKDSVWKPGLRLIDRDGHLVHEWRINPKNLFSDSAASRWGVDLEQTDIHGAHLFPNGDVLVNLEYIGIARLDACGRALWRLPLGTHHAVVPAEDGSFWIPGVSHETPAESPRYPSGYPGLDGPIHHDYMLRVSEDGNVLDTIRVLDVLYANGLARHIPHALLNRFDPDPYGKDIVHLNDVEPLGASLADEYPLFEAGDLVVSLRNLHLVFVFDSGSGRVRWHTSHPFIHQHDPDFIGDGWIGVFDNNQDGTDRGTMLGGSRIVALQPHTDSLKVLFPTARSDPFYTDTRGKWQKLENGNLLLVEARAGRVVEVVPDGRTVWDWVVEPYDESRVPYVTEAIRYELAPARVKSWPCSPADPIDDQQEGSDS